MTGLRTNLWPWAKKGPLCSPALSPISLAHSLSHSQKRLSHAFFSVLKPPTFSSPASFSERLFPHVPPRNNPKRLSHSPHHISRFISSAHVFCLLKEGTVRVPKISPSTRSSLRPYAMSGGTRAQVQRTGGCGSIFLLLNCSCWGNWMA